MNRQREHSKTRITRSNERMKNHVPDDSDSDVNQTTRSPQEQEHRLRLYLVRHGESKANEQGVFAGQLDSPLTERGIIDAKSLGETSDFLIFQPTMQAAKQSQTESHPYQFDAVYSSDLIRAHDTCKLILEGMRTRTQNNLDNSHVEDQSGISMSSNIHLDDRLRERSYGTLQGMPWISDRNETDKIWRDTHREDELPPIFETDDDIWIRVKLFLKDLIQNELSTTANAEIRTKHILITSHGGVLRQILMRLVGVDKLKKMGAKFDTKRKNRLLTPNTSVTILDFLNSNLNGDEDDDALPGIQTEMILFANTDHLKDRVRIHDD